MFAFCSVLSGRTLNSAWRVVCDWLRKGSCGRDPGCEMMRRWEVVVSGRARVGVTL